jgi:hypothetical protein
MTAIRLALVIELAEPCEPRRLILYALPRREILTPSQRMQLLAFPDDDGEAPTLNSDKDTAKKAEVWRSVKLISLKANVSVPINTSFKFP